MKAAEKLLYRMRQNEALFKHNEQIPNYILCEYEDKKLSIPNDVYPFEFVKQVAYEYAFYKRASETSPDLLTRYITDTRAINALARCGIYTMHQLDLFITAIGFESLKKIRLIGGKTYDAIRSSYNNYLISRGRDSETIFEHKLATTPTRIPDVYINGEMMLFDNTRQVEKHLSQLLRESETGGSIRIDISIISE